MSGDARAEILGRIRAALPRTANATLDSVSAEWDALPRDYRRHSNLAQEAVLEMLEDRLRDYDAEVLRTPAAGLADAIASRLRVRGVHRLVTPPGLVEWLGQPLPPGFDFVEDFGLSPAGLDALDGVVTGATVAIAATGTLVLQSVPGQGRRAPTLVPDYHLCVVRVGDVVETVPEAIARLEAHSTLATTFISGPSATADIEMTRIKGVHGPRFLDVLLLL